jgi:hypothetical protein
VLCGFSPWCGVGNVGVARVVGLAYTVDGGGSASVLGGSCSVSVQVLALFLVFRSGGVYTVGWIV